MIFNILKRNVLLCEGLSRMQSRKHLRPLLSPMCPSSVRLNSVMLKCSQSFEALNPFGKIILSSKRAVDYKLTSVDPQQYPSQSQAFVTIVGDNIINCHLDDNVISISDDATSIEEGASGERVECLIQVPIKFDIVARLGADSSISITNFENSELNVEIQHGQCYLRNIQTGTYRIRSESGEIVSEKLLQGNGTIQSRQGKVDIHKLQAQSVTLETHSGDVNITNLYANTSNINTESGRVHIVNSHWDTKIKVKDQGHIKIDSVDGCLRAEVNKGDIEVAVSQHDHVLLYTREGNIDISVPQTLSSRLEIKGNEVKVDNEMDVNTVKQKDGQVYIETTLKGLETPKRTLGNIHVQKPMGFIGDIQAHAARGTVSLKSTTSNWISAIQANLKQK